jgi:hypothetical protein
MLNLLASAAAVNALVREPPQKASPKHFDAATNFIASLNYHIATGASFETIKGAVATAVDTRALPVVEAPAVEG